MFAGTRLPRSLGNFSASSRKLVLLFCRKAKKQDRETYWRNKTLLIPIPTYLLHEKRSEFRVFRRTAVGIEQGRPWALQLARHSCEPVQVFWSVGNKLHHYYLKLSECT